MSYKIVFIFFICAFLAGCKPAAPGGKSNLSLTSSTPATGSSAGGNTLTITGNNISSTATVSVGGSNCSIISATSSKITCTTSAKVTGTYDISVTNPAKQTKTLTNAFTYLDPVSVSAISPTSGIYLGGTSVTITGSGFENNATVFFGSTECVSVVVLSDTAITCTTSSQSAGVVNVTVTNSNTATGTKASAFTFRAPPTITSVSPYSGTLGGGTTITVNGTGFYTGAVVDLGGQACLGVFVVNSTRLTCITQSNAAGVVSATVTNADAQSGTLASAYVYRAAPTISAVSPLTGAASGLYTVTITGSGFLSGATVTLGGSNCTGVNVVNAATLTCTAPARSAGLVSAIVTNSDSQAVTAAGAFTYIAAPTVTSVTPAIGALAGGTNISITGTGFVSGATVSVGGSTCTPVVFVSATNITCLTTAHAAGAINIIVTNPDTQTGNKSSAYTYRAAPLILSVSPTQGALAGLGTMTILGNGFYGSTVTVGGSSCTSPVISGTASITCTLPAHIAGVVDVIVTNNDSQSHTLASSYSYNPSATISVITPALGALAGGTSITISGTGFISGATASLGGSACSSYSVVDSTTFTCITAARSAGLVGLSFTNGDGQITTSLNAYTYLGAPIVTSVSPTSGINTGGTPITITGSGFVSGATVSIGGTPCAGVIFVDATTLTCTTPVHTAGTVNIVVTNPDTQIGTGSALYTFRGAPTVTSVSPTSGSNAGGATIIITGTGFYTGSTITVGGVVCGSVNVIGSTSISCTTGAHASGAVNIVVTNADTQTGTGTGIYTYNSAPTVSSISPSDGILAGGETVTILGAGFYSGANVSLGGSNCTDIVVLSSSSLTCKTPARTAGAVIVVVTNADSQSGNLGTPFTYKALPVVTSLTPNSGAIAGGTNITITGTGFITTGATVSVGGTACTVPVVGSVTSITCTTAAHTAGVVDVVVTNLDTQVGTGTSLYTYRGVPTVTSALPNTGALAGATAITITGTGFYAGATVNVGGAACTSVNVSSATTITCTTPAHIAGAVNIEVTNADTQMGVGTGLFTYRASPTVTAVSPIDGIAAGGNALTITGSGFYAGAGVSIGGTPCTAVVVVSPTSITCTSPAHASGLVTVAVTNADTQTGNMGSAYTYRPIPVVTSVAPPSGNASTTTAITITGSGFIAGATVSIGGSNCTGLTVVTSTSITCTAPAHAAGVVSIVVTNTDTQAGTGSSLFTYRGIPTVTSVSPSSGTPAGGTVITITGTGYYTGPSVTVGGVACGALTVTSATSITCTTPVHAAGVVNVVVTNADTQIGTGTNLYTYQAAPTVASISGNTGSVAGGKLVTITGTNFYSGAAVSFGASACTSVTVVSLTSITCLTPAHALGAVTVTVTNSDTQAGSLPTAFTYFTAPTVTSVSPVSGSLNGLTPVTITGTGFIDGATVSFGGSSCTDVIVASATTITCKTSSNSAGLITATVVNANSTTGSRTNAYTYLSQAVLEWQVGFSSPTPPNPDDYGSTSVNVTHTYTLKNIGDISTSNITISQTGTNQASWTKPVDNCNGAPLASNATCTVQMTFLGADVAVLSGAHSAVISANASTGGTSTNNMSATKP